MAGGVLACPSKPVETPTASVSFQLKSITKLDPNMMGFKTKTPCLNTENEIVQNSARIAITDQCLSDKGIDQYACSSWFKIDLGMPNGTNTLITGQRKIQLNGSHTSKNFLSLLDYGQFTYWIDTMEVFIDVGNNIIPIGFIHGQQPNESYPIMLDRIINIQTQGQAKSIYLKYTRKCHNENMDWLNNSLPFKDSDHTTYTVNSINHQSIQ